MAKRYDTNEKNALLAMRDSLAALELSLGATRATGSITFADNPADGDYVRIADADGEARTFEFDGGAAAVGALELTGNPLDGELLSVATVADPQQSVVFEFDAGVAASGSVELTDVPAPGDTITFGALAVFEFVSDAVAYAGANTPVQLGLDAEESASALGEAINDAQIGVTASVLGVTCSLDADAPGVAGNIEITTTSLAVDCDSMAGGLDAGDGAVGEGNVPVAIGATAADTMAALIVAWNTAAVGVTAAASEPPDAACTLGADAIGPSGNVTIEAGDSVEVTAMAGGADPGEGPITAGAFEVAIGEDAAETMANLLLAINLTALAITAAPVAGDPLSCQLTADEPGSGGNIAITASGASITVSGMSGGADIQSRLAASAATLGGLITGGGQVPTRPREVGSPAVYPFAIDGLAAGEILDITISDDDGTDVLELIFEADPGAYGGPRTAIQLGADDAETMANLIDALAGLTDKLSAQQGGEPASAAVLTSVLDGASITLGGHGAGHISPLTTISGDSEVSLRTLQDRLVQVQAPAESVPVLLAAGVKTCADQSVAEALVAVSVPCRYVVVMARVNPATGEAANTRPVLVGLPGSPQIAVMPTNYEGVLIPIANADDLVVKAAVNGEGVVYAIYGAPQ